MSATETRPEPLTVEMIKALQAEAAAAGDAEMAEICEQAFQGTRGLAPRHSVCAAINDARGMDDSKPFVRVVPYAVEDDTDLTA